MLTFKFEIELFRVAITAQKVLWSVLGVFLEVSYFRFHEGIQHFPTFMLKILKMLSTSWATFIDENLFGSEKLRTLGKVFRTLRFPVKSMRSTPSIHEVTVPQS